MLKISPPKIADVVFLPNSAPEMNPDEGIGQYLKRDELGNVCCATMDARERALIHARERLRHQPSTSLFAGVSP